jgi:hypothetical protein
LLPGSFLFANKCFREQLLFTKWQVRLAFACKNFYNWLGNCVKRKFWEYYFSGDRFRRNRRRAALLKQQVRRALLFFIIKSNNFGINNFLTKWKNKRLDKSPRTFCEVCPKWHFFKRHLAIENLLNFCLTFFTQAKRFTFFYAIEKLYLPR